MKIILLGVVLFLVQVSIQKPQFVGDCSNAARFMERNANECGLMDCDIHDEEADCGPLVTPECGPGKSIVTKKDDSKVYPECCPQQICE